MAEFYSARGWEIPPLPWTNLSPPFSLTVHRLRSARARPPAGAAVPGHRPARRDRAAGRGGRPVPDGDRVLARLAPLDFPDRLAAPRLRPLPLRLRGQARRRGSPVAYEKQLYILHPERLMAPYGEKAGATGQDGIVAKTIGLDRTKGTESCGCDGSSDGIWESAEVHSTPNEAARNHRDECHHEFDHSFGRAVVFGGPGSDCSIPAATVASRSKRSVDHPVSLGRKLPHRLVLV